MGITVSAITRNKADVTVKYRDDSMTVSYFPDKFTPAMEKDARTRQESDWSSGLIIDMLLPLLADWDLFVDEENGTKVELSVDGLASVPINLLVEILRQVTEDMRPGEAKGANSRGGSLKRV